LIKKKDYLLTKSLKPTDLNHTRDPSFRELLCKPHLEVAHIFAPIFNV